MRPDERRKAALKWLLVEKPTFFATLEVVQPVSRSRAFARSMRILVTKACGVSAIADLKWKELIFATQIFRECGLHNNAATE